MPTVFNFRLIISHIEKEISPFILFFTWTLASARSILNSEACDPSVFGSSRTFCVLSSKHT